MSWLTNILPHGLVKRSVSQSYLEWIYGTGGTVKATSESILGLAVALRCQQVLSETLAGLPKAIKAKSKDGVNELNNHFLTDLLKHKVNQSMTSLTWHELAMRDCINGGNHYAIIERSGSIPVALHPITADRVKPIYQNNTLIYEVQNLGVLQDHEVLHIKGLSRDGVTGIGNVQAFREGFGYALSTQKHGKEVIENGANLSGWIEYPQPIKDKQTKDKLKEGWDNNYAGLSKSKTAILDGGAKYHAIGMNMMDAEFIRTRQLQNIEIATIYGVPLHMVNITEQATYNNVEHLATQFVQFTMLPWIQRFETELETKLLRNSEKDTHFIDYNVNGLLRGDIAARTQFYEVMTRIGAMNRNEVRQKENLNPVDGGDRYYVPMQTIPTDRVDDWINSKGNGKENNTGND